MVDFETKEPLDDELDFDGAGGRIPPEALSGASDEFGDWEEWRGEIEIDELELAASMMRHPASRYSEDIQLTQALLRNGWTEKHARVKDVVSKMNLLPTSGVISLDEFRPRSPFSTFPPDVA